MNLNFLWLFSPQLKRLPSIISKHDWEYRIKHFSTSFLPCDLGLRLIEEDGLSISISGIERANLECLYFANKQVFLDDCYYNIESLFADYDFSLIQKLLERCTSYRVKRLFLCIAEMHDVPWLKHLDMSKIDLGKGVVSIASKKGVYFKKYKLVLPQAFVDNHEWDNHSEF